MYLEYLNKNIFIYYWYCIIKIFLIISIINNIFINKLIYSLIIIANLIKSNFYIYFYNKSMYYINKYYVL